MLFVVDNSIHDCVGDSASVCHEKKSESVIKAQVKSSKSCPVIYKVSKQHDGRTIHELLSSNGFLSRVGTSINTKSLAKDRKDGVKDMKLFVTNTDEDYYDEHQLLRKKKLNIVLNETGKCSLYNGDDKDVADIRLLENTNVLKEKSLRNGHKRSFSLSSSTTAAALVINRDHSACDMNKSNSFCIQTQNNVSSKSIRSAIMEISSHSPILS